MYSFVLNYFAKIVALTFLAKIKYSFLNFVFYYNPHVILFVLLRFFQKLTIYSYEKCLIVTISKTLGQLKSNVKCFLIVFLCFRFFATILTLMFLALTFLERFHSFLNFMLDHNPHVVLFILLHFFYYKFTIYSYEKCLNLCLIVWLSRFPKHQVS